MMIIVMVIIKFIFASCCGSSIALKSDVSLSKIKK